MLRPWGTRSRSVRSVILCSRGIFLTHNSCILDFWWILVCPSPPILISFSYALVLRLSLGVLFDPSKGIASAFPDGTNSPAFNHGVQFYFTFWAILCALYLIAAVRTNVVFMVHLPMPFELQTNSISQYVFLTLVLTFAFCESPSADTEALLTENEVAAAYRQSGLGNANMSLTFRAFRSSRTYSRNSLIVIAP